MDDELLTVDEIAQELKVVAQTVRNYIDRGELTAIRVGQRRVRVRRSALDDFIEGRDASSATRGRGQRIAELERQVAQLEQRVKALEDARGGSLG